MTPTVPNVNTLWARCLVEEFARSGLRDVVICPGSRSTPLVVQFGAHPQIRDHGVVDERQAAFFALGLALSTKRPVALLCTSGTAAANFFPAICEASHARVPLLVLTADRPAELQDCGAPQAMDQQRLYGNYVRYFHQVAQPEATAQKLRYLRSLACGAYLRTTTPRPGPVHLNVPFRKPLEPLPVEVSHRDAVTDEFLEAEPLASEGRAGERPFVAFSMGQTVANATTVESFLTRLKAARRPLIVAGADPDGERYAGALQRLAEELAVPVVAEATSGQRFRAKTSAAVISTGDFLFGSRVFDEFGAPDLVVRVGRAPLLWSAQTRVREWGDVEQILVSPHVEGADPDHLVSAQIVSEEAPFFEALLEMSAASRQAGKERRRWYEGLVEAHRVSCQALEAARPEKASWSTARFWEVLGARLPENGALFVSNSMPIRDVDSFLVTPPRALKLFFNRGINGIDGIVSTGLGVAASGAHPTVIVTGDVALRHDISALMLAKELGLQATVVVCDNGGGAIFDYLPIAEFSAVHEKHFFTPWRAGLQKTPGLTIHTPETAAELARALQESFAAPGLQVVHLRFDREQEKKERDELRADVICRLNDWVATKTRENQ